MCGFIKRVTDRPAYRALIRQLGWEELLGDDTPGVQRFYPAFGGDAGRQIKNLVINSRGRLSAVDATWWFDCEEQDGRLVVGKRTTFNARNLDSPFWKGALRHHRGVVIADAIGESRIIQGRKHQYLMESDTPFLLGALYRRFSSDLYACAIITRDEHPKFRPYHDKAFPLFLPIDRTFLDTWLDSSRDQADEIDALLHHPRLFPTLRVQEVKTYKSEQAIGEPALLPADDV